MLIGYARISKTGGSQLLDQQHDALTSAGVAAVFLRTLFDPDGGRLRA